MVTKIILIIVILITTCYCHKLYQLPGDTGLNVRQLITKYKYPFENHTIHTDDGYILEAHRIPYGRNASFETIGAPVLIMPGLLASSEEWVNTGPEKSFGFILADKGYDVWLVNYRGTTWSRKHVILNPDVDKEQFWTFSFHEIAKYDLPAFINYILKTTKHEKLYYIGHSQGTSTFFALASVMPEYNQKFRLAAALSPIAYMGNTKSNPLHSITLYKDVIEKLRSKYGVHEFLKNSSFVTFLATLLCRDDSPFQDVCTRIMYKISGYSPEQLNKVPVTQNNASGISKQLARWLVYKTQHAAQLAETNKFRQYDYGWLTNFRIYGQLDPPAYDLTKVTAPVALYYGSRDLYCQKQDVDQTASELSNVVVNTQLPGFAHMDAIWGNDAVNLVFDDILMLMKKY